MRRVLQLTALFVFVLIVHLPLLSLAQEWQVRGKQGGILKVVNLGLIHLATINLYMDSLINLDKDNNWVPGLAEDWRWLDEKTIEFKLRHSVSFQNGETFNAHSPMVNWAAYRSMESPRGVKFALIPDETELRIIDDYTVRFIFPEPEGLAVVKFWYFGQFAPTFFAEHESEENNWGYLPKAGPWAAAGPFRLVEGQVSAYGRPSDRVVLEAFEGYWDRRYPKVKRIEIDNRLIGDRKEAMRLCRETEGEIDIVSHIGPLDTLKVAESPFVKVVKSKDIRWLRGIFNIRKKESKWRDIRLRKAINYSINREELMKYAAKGNAYNLGGIIPEGAFGHNANVVPYTYDTTKARPLLEEAGYPDGFELKIIALEHLRVEAQIISRMFERVGLKAYLEILPEPEFWSKIVTEVSG